MNNTIKILFLEANPEDTERLRLDKEVRSIDQALRQAQYRDKFDIEQKLAVRVSDLQEHFLRYEPHIVHELAQKLRDAHHARRLLIEFADLPDRKQELRKLGEASGKFHALANYLRSGICSTVIHNYWPNRRFAADGGVEA